MLAMAPLDPGLIGVSASGCLQSWDSAWDLQHTAPTERFNRMTRGYDPNVAKARSNQVESNQQQFPGYAVKWRF
jgi:hypothetical protein